MVNEHGICREFPAPPKLIRSAFTDLRNATITDEKVKRQVGPRTQLSRPWDPPTCPPNVRRQLWSWLDEVAAWLNHEYGWQTERVIPACWPAHPHIVHELAVVAGVRHAASDALTADPLENWHQSVLPTFLDRLNVCLGGVPCTPGHHKTWPAAGRFADYESAEAAGKRRAAFDVDVKISAADAPADTSATSVGQLRTS